MVNESLVQIWKTTWVCTFEVERKLLFPRCNIIISIIMNS